MCADIFLCAVINVSWVINNTKLLFVLPIHIWLSVFLSISLYIVEDKIKRCMRYFKGELRLGSEFSISLGSLKRFVAASSAWLRGLVERLWQFPP
mmetsp:Transcript_85624/g.165898  ORF Transcript_85624/g.165898 Transcript_85624/m.165898 type:complete len:95 (-) Transcript_85624:217-501(-)